LIESSDWDVPKMKVSRNCVINLLGLTNFFFPKFHRLSYFLNFFVFFFNFLDFSLLFHLFILVKKFWKLFWLLFVCIGDLSKQFWKILNFFLKEQSCEVGCETSNRRHRVKHHVSFLVLTNVIFNVSWVNVDSKPDDKDLSEPTIKAIFLLVKYFVIRIMNYLYEI